MGGCDHHFICTSRVDVRVWVYFLCRDNRRFGSCNVRVGGYVRFGVKSFQWRCDGLFIIWVLHSQPGIEGLDCAGVCDSKCRAIHPTWVPSDIHPWMLCIWVWARATAQVLLHDVAMGLLSVDKILADMHRR
jgi:hypothetical protein